MPYHLGRSFVETYYKHSPSIAGFISAHDAVRTVTRWSLLPVVGLSWMALHFGAAATLLLLMAGLIMIFIVGHRFILTANRRRWT